MGENGCTYMPPGLLYFVKCQENNKIFLSVQPLF